MKKFYNTTCSVYTKSVTTVRWSQVQALVSKYADIKCAIFWKSKSLNPSTQAIQTDSNEYTMVLDSVYSWVAIGDIVVINSKQYKVLNDPMPHERANWQIDNYELSINRTTPVTLS